MREGRDRAEATAEATPKKKRKRIRLKLSRKKLIILAAIMIALGGGGYAGYVIFYPQPVAAPPPPEPGQVIALDAMTINLADGHYLKLKFALQATAEAEVAPEGSRALDIAIELFTNRSIEELSSNSERLRLKNVLKERVKKAYEDTVMDVYFTEFVMQ